MFLTRSSFISHYNFGMVLLELSQGKHDFFSHKLSEINLKHVLAHASQDYTEKNDIFSYVQLIILHVIRNHWYIRVNFV